ncbi:hypothetical protein CEUSTIGMA_g1969.t1 [Chlamydomonas eustigma]|uniref:Uncharacterized protein n=1 Tax=Chlamydomonas eustigma TaxID=1157962 RepID=A0A250WVG2_9CHLO|nr:hypothetical protein CEUSTIGMA_g1969.t1 [Chlamydomonas eustigma]|eukprot:GAX74520.1 hypothetical protein CEUSTIGMA_g1969.t1 [Chlamydomonas eustigma]
MGGPTAQVPTAHIRIKGHWQSVMRFFFISVGYMMTWVLITSELGYYSKRFGPQILLQLNFAFYIPSIPVLLLSGQMEKFLDHRFGKIESMAIRLVSSLAGNLAICASFPFTTKTHDTLLWTVVMLGIVSAIAFSTSYQLVQWFRHADIIALGIGTVGSGPLVLIIQLGLVQLVAWPERWQWITMFETSAAIILVGFISCISLFVQYFSIMKGTKTFTDPSIPPSRPGSALKDTDASTPLLEAVHEEQIMAEERVAGTPVNTSGFISGRGVSPFQSRSYWYNSREGAFAAQDQDEDWHMELAMAPTSNNIILAPDSGMPFVMYHPKDLIPGSYDDNYVPILSRRSEPLDNRRLSLSPSKLESFASMRRAQPSTCSVAFKKYRAHSFGVPSNFNEQDTNAITSVQSFPSVQHSTHSIHKVSALRVGDNLPCSTRANSGVVPLSQSHQQEGGLAQGVDAKRELGDDDAGSEEMTLAEETSATIAIIWPVLLSFLTCVTVLYTIFPFFTYIPSSGLLGDQLARILFFTRLGADTVGRFAPRLKALVTKSPTVLLSMSATMVTAAVILIVYIKGSVYNDIFAVGVIVFLWLSAGYINTCANFLAPSMVPDHLRVRASALMALTFQVAHFAGLILAAFLVYVLFGDIAGR